MITEEDNKIQLLVLPTRTVFTSFAQSVLAVFYNECISGRKVSFFKHRGVCSVQWTAQRPATLGSRRCITYFMVGPLA